LKNNVQDDGGIGWLAISHRRFEVNLFGRLNGIVIEAMTQAAHYPHHTQAAGCFQNNLQENLAFNL
jgi:hypothetical protein